MPRLYGAVAVGQRNSLAAREEQIRRQSAANRLHPLFLLIFTRRGRVVTGGEDHRARAEFARMGRRVRGAQIEEGLFMKQMNIEQVLSRQQGVWYVLMVS